MFSCHNVFFQLIQFLMSLVQPTRPGNANGNNVGVKRPYQLMINNAAHNADGYPGRLKNVKLDKDLSEDLNEDNPVCCTFHYALKFMV